MAALQYISLLFAITISFTSQHVYGPENSFSDHITSEDAAQVGSVTKLVLYDAASDVAMPGPGKILIYGHCLLN